MIKLRKNALLFHVNTSWHNLHTSPITTCPNIEHFLVGCRVCCEEYVCKWFNALVTTRSVWNIIKVKLKMFLRFLCYSNENGFLFHHFYLLLSILEILRQSTVLTFLCPNFLAPKNNHHLEINTRAWIKNKFRLTSFFYIYLHAKY